MLVKCCRQERFTGETMYFPLQHTRTHIISVGVTSSDAEFGYLVKVLTNRSLCYKD